MILWMDFETTGLDAATGQILEGAVVLTDDDYQDLDSFHTLVRPKGYGSRSDTIDWDEVIGNPDVIAMHTASGLIPEMDAGAGMTHLFDFERMACDLLRRHGVSSDDPVQYAGSGVERFDVGWCILHLPELYAMLTYHAAHDLGTIRRTLRRWDLAPDLPGEIPHRAMADVRRSIAECIHYRDTLQPRAAGHYRRMVENPMLVPIGHPCPWMANGRCGCYGPHPYHMEPQPELMALISKALRGEDETTNDSTARPWALLRSARAHLDQAASESDDLASPVLRAHSDLAEAIDLIEHDGAVPGDG